MRIGEMFVSLGPNKDQLVQPEPKHEPVAQLDRVSDSGSEGWGFESPLVHYLKASETIQRMNRYSSTLHLSRFQCLLFWDVPSGQTFNRCLNPNDSG